MISLEKLLINFKPINNDEYEGAKMMTNLPFKSKFAYLNIIFSAVDTETQRDIIDPLCLPSQLREFYRIYNGVDLFFDNFNIYGFFPKVYLLERQNFRKRYPYNIIDINHEYFDDLINNELFIFGSYYGYDNRSEVFVEKESGRIWCSVGDNLRKTRASWPSFEIWLKEEIARLSECFDEYGHMLVDTEEDLLPGGKRLIN